MSAMDKYTILHGSIHTTLTKQLTLPNAGKEKKIRKTPQTRYPPSTVTKNTENKNNRARERERALSALEARWGLFPAYVQQQA